MSYSNNSSALRNATAKASLDFYDELADKTLLIIKKLEGHNHNLVTVERVKKELGINYKVLSRILKELSDDGALEFYVAPEKQDDYSTSDMHVEITPVGDAMLRRAFESLQRKVVL
ncbi:hypothetical protein ABRZ80_05250 [Vibrio vulnificus]|nr:MULTISPECIES: hypothetical protein [Vibrio]EGQ7762833.1 hypothetical protein [Vibrio alginolyticus]ELP2653642.1 hypothetical protein [Vibrio fluvialis]ELS0762084.1 hypothetical protein [Vibrio vulnificus]NWK16859.1 hypothetical protein [Vibrio parahaemolyticus]ELF6831604.1 hypothetical protein [Vibrio cholerae]